MRSLHSGVLFMFGILLNALRTSLLKNIHNSWSKPFLAKLAIFPLKWFFDSRRILVFTILAIIWKAKRILELSNMSRIWVRQNRRAKSEQDHFGHRMLAEFRTLIIRFNYVHSISKFLLRHRSHNLEFSESWKITNDWLFIPPLNVKTFFPINIIWLSMRHSSW